MYVSLLSYWNLCLLTLATTRDGMGLGHAGRVGSKLVMPFVAV